MKISFPETIRRRRRHLPHWEVARARYFVTVRCGDSLPADALARVAEIQRDLADIEPRSPQFAELQRRLFRTLEKYVDAGFGSCPLRQSIAVEIVADELSLLGDCGFAAPHYTIMPNHWHALLLPVREDPMSLSAVMKRLKGRTAKRIRAALGGSGAFWQGEWFDRWVRDDAEWERMVAYVRNNPVRAGIVRTWEEHPWTK